MIIHGTKAKKGSRRDEGGATETVLAVGDGTDGDVGRMDLPSKS